MAVLVLAGTRKGLFLLHGDDARTRWELEGPLLTGWSIYHAILDRRDGAVYAAANNWVYGATVQRSDDLGRTWSRSEQLGLPEESGLKLEAAWHDAPRPRPRPRPVARRIRARLGEILVSTGMLIAGPAEDCAPADAVVRPA